ncbi:MAG TPA: hypothetical protein VNM22_11210 [Candidatus Limnocylindrales bacterium]|nr:hypothetical protein [Candidatus Limnocylindrales bacterium]
MSGEITLRLQSEYNNYELEQCIFPEFTNIMDGFIISLRMLEEKLNIELDKDYIRDQVKELLLSQVRYSLDRVIQDSVRKALTDLEHRGIKVRFVE